MAAFGAFVLGRAAWQASVGHQPEPVTMGAIDNVAVVAAAVGVSGTGTGWPGLGVAVIMGALALAAGSSVIRQARAEMSCAGRESGAPP